jgi:hypothetical protein
MKQIASALVKAQKAFGPALKTSTNPHFRSKYADLGACIDAVIDALNNNGIYLLQKNYDCADGVMLETVFIHESGEMLETGVIHFPASKHDAQGFASCLTYARRYSLMSACGISPEPEGKQPSFADDDGNAASRSRIAPAVNPLDAIKPAVAAPAFELSVPGKEPRLYASGTDYLAGMLDLRTKVEKSSLATRTKMTKLRELNEANEQIMLKIEPENRSKLVADYTLRLKRLGAQLNEDVEELTEDL